MTSGGYSMKSSVVSVQWVTLSVGGSSWAASFALAACGGRDGDEKKDEDAVVVSFTESPTR